MLYLCMERIYSTDNLTERVYRSYQRSIYCNPKFKIQYPQNVTELVDLVKESIAKGYRVKGGISSFEINTCIIHVCSY